MLKIKNSIFNASIIINHISLVYDRTFPLLFSVRLTNTVHVVDPRFTLTLYVDDFSFSSRSWSVHNFHWYPRPDSLTLANANTTQMSDSPCHLHMCLTGKDAGLSWLSWTESHAQLRRAAFAQRFCDSCSDVLLFNQQRKPSGSSALQQHGPTGTHHPVNLYLDVFH